MSDAENDSKDFCVDRAKAGRALCKKCKGKLPAGELRVGKVVPNHFGSGDGKSKQWYHLDCLFKAFETQRATTKKIESCDDIDGWDDLSELDKDLILEKIHGSGGGKAGGSKAASGNKKIIPSNTPTKSKNFKDDSIDNLFREFRRICALLSDESSYLGKTSILNKFFRKGSNGKKFEGDLYLWMKLLLPSSVKRVYNLQSKQLIKLFSKLFKIDQNVMLKDLEEGDISETIRTFFESSKQLKPAGKSKLKLYEIDEFLDKLSDLTKEDEQSEHFKQICKKCTSNDLKMLIRFIKHDLRINSGPKHILNAMHPDAYSSYQSSRDLKTVVEKFGDKVSENNLKSPDASKSKKNGVGVQLMYPISPMLAEACKSVEKAIEKCPQGMYSEIKYDGERVQLHKQGNEFKFFSRNLKPVLDHKIQRCKEFIPKAFPLANDLILDCEIIMVDTETGQLLPFGTLGKHKKTKFDSAEVCLFIFDCIYYNGEDLTQKTLKERRKILEENIQPIKSHVQLSEYHFIQNNKDLSKMIAKVLKLGLEGLVLKNVDGLYEPGKRHWLKVKKDYLFDGKMADTADLLVLGGWFGTGKKGGMLSVFLMGCFDEKNKLWKTVTKVSGFDDKTMKELQKNLKPLMERADPDQPPKWILSKKAMIPDFLTKDPSTMPVWEITGAEFTKADHHTAGISIRFPRVTKIRDDKNHSTATNFDELKTLFKNSKESVDVKLLIDSSDDDDVKILTTMQNNDIDRKILKKEEVDDEQMDLIESNVKNRNLKVKKEKDALISDDRLKEIDNLFENRNLSDNNEENNTSIKNKRKQDEITTNNGSPIKKIKREDLKCDGIFNQIIIFVIPEATGSLEKYLKNFQEQGGKVTEKSIECTHAIHKDGFISEDLASLRNKFKPECRHVTFDWIRDSIDEKELAEIILYPVVLKNCELIKN